MGAWKKGDSKFLTSRVQKTIIMCLQKYHLYIYLDALYNDDVQTK